MAGTRMLCKSLQQTATELLRLYDAYEAGEPFEPLDVDALMAWRRMSIDVTYADVELINMRAV